MFEWLNNQLLRMDWLAALVRNLLESGGLDTTTRLGSSLHFFLYDVIKIFILLGVLIFSVSWIQSYFPPERTRRILGGLTGLPANIAGALLGTLTPSVPVRRSRCSSASPARACRWASPSPF